MPIRISLFKTEVTTDDDRVISLREYLAEPVSIPRRLLLVYQGLVCLAWLSAVIASAKGFTD
jgi:hypothetical protein